MSFKSLLKFALVPVAALSISAAFAATPTAICPSNLAKIQVTKAPIADPNSPATYVLTDGVSFPNYSVEQSEFIFMDPVGQPSVSDAKNLLTSSHLVSERNIGSFTTCGYSVVQNTTLKLESALIVLTR